jgi:hypothetical protein
VSCGLIPNGREGIVAPITGGLEFLDAHWKALLILVIPFALPFLREIVAYVRKVGPVELRDVPLEMIGKGEKPSPRPQGERL